jgi:hypothetical protein
MKLGGRTGFESVPFSITGHALVADVVADVWPATRGERASIEGGEHVLGE